MFTPRDLETGFFNLTGQVGSGDNPEASVQDGLGKSSF